MSYNGVNGNGKQGAQTVLQARLGEGMPTIRDASVEVAPQTAIGGLLVLATGEVVVGGASARFTQHLVLVADPAVPGGVRIKADICRTGPGTSALNNASGAAPVPELLNNFFSSLQSNPAGVLAAYRPTSIMHREGAAAQGPDAIATALQPFQGAAFEITTLDTAVASSSPVVISALVTGAMRLEGQQHPLLFTRVFAIQQDEAGQLYFANDIFSLNYA